MVFGMDQKRVSAIPVLKGALGATLTLKNAIAFRTKLTRCSKPNLKLNFKVNSGKRRNCVCDVDIEMTKKV
ncbi:hypothetical protein AUQ44_19055 [Vibrio cidicii]|uniref:Uncharacterized protein n=1 Tax=Vibrio cidicii TaxID=1763883 RepID=A0A151JDW7_9VIBR|nr:hypothetical protein AUQ44_19055 [Vibrio cidicii]